MAVAAAPVVEVVVTVPGALICVNGFVPMAGSVMFGTAVSAFVENGLSGSVGSCDPNGMVVDIGGMVVDVAAAVDVDGSWKLGSESVVSAGMVTFCVVDPNAGMSKLGSSTFVPVLPVTAPTTLSST